MATLRKIRQKIKSTKSIEKTTKAMETISSVKFQKAQLELNATKPYQHKIQQLLFDTLKRTTGSHKLFEDNTSNKEGLLIITSEKGLCGSYNTNIIKKAMDYIISHRDKDIKVLAIGKKGRDYLKRNWINITSEYFNIFKKFSSVQSDVISEEIVKLFLSEKLSKFNVIYSKYESLFSQPVVIKQILPIEKVKVDDLKFDYIYEPSKEILIEELLNRYFKSNIFHLLIESYTSEIAARRNAMQNATKNASELIDDLTLHLNKLRQQQITKELIEIVGSIEAGRV
ncbi:MAG: ATP synthase F1 subunit gamma [Elusimicrobia bacterium RIFOXYD2_FULL_34_15]|nr:MAG: ATP synthase F1 subunit gamma [Elusimicrobia bacterium RIFOXYD2_FULL_34_15]